MNNKLYEIIFKRKSFHLFLNVGDEKITQEELDDSMYNNLSNKAENIISHCFYPHSIQRQCELVRKVSVE